MSGRYWERGSLEVVRTPLSELTRHPENANQGDEDAIQESISVNGFYQPVIVQASTGYIIAGNHRYLAAGRLGAEAIPTIFLDVDDVQAKRIMVADNRTTRIGKDDPYDLARLLDTLIDTDYGLMGTGFTANDHRLLLESIDEPLTFDEDPDPDPGVGASAPKIGDLEVQPVTDSDGLCIALRITRTDGESVSSEQFQRVREALGLQRLAPPVIRGYLIEGWER